MELETKVGLLTSTSNVRHACSSCQLHIHLELGEKHTMYMHVCTSRVLGYIICYSVHVCVELSSCRIEGIFIKGWQTIYNHVKVYSSTLLSSSRISCAQIRSRCLSLAL